MSLIENTTQNHVSGYELSKVDYFLYELAGKCTVAEFNENNGYVTSKSPFERMIVAITSIRTEGEEDAPIITLDGNDMKTAEIVEEFSPPVFINTFHKKLKHHGFKTFGPFISLMNYERVRINNLPPETIISFTGHNIRIKYQDNADFVWAY